MNGNAKVSKRRHFARRAALGILAVWAGFWLLFAVGHLVPGGHDGEPVPSLTNLIKVVAFAGPILGLVVFSFLFNRLGGLLLIAHATYSAWYYGSFDQWGALVFLTLPAAVVGLTLLVVGGDGLRLDSSNSASSNTKASPESDADG